LVFREGILGVLRRVLYIDFAMPTPTACVFKKVILLFV
jgi:hypothetical protein